MTDRKKPHERRMELRDSIWPNARSLVWSRKEKVGFSTVPRLLPWICTLIKALSSTGDPSSVYIDLWCRVFDEGFVDINDDAECAFAAGYSGTRALRTWRERMLSLQELGFIDAKPAGIREYARVLLHDPVRHCVRLRSATPGKVPDEWWNSFIARAGAIGADLAKYAEEVEAELAQSRKVKQRSKRVDGSRTS